MKRNNADPCPPEELTPGEMSGGGRPLPPWLGYTAAAAAAATATLARLALDPVLGDRYPFIACLLAVVLVAWFVRTAAAIVTLAVGGASAFGLFVLPRHPSAPTDPGVLLGTGLFLAVAAAVLAMSHAMRAARRRCEGLLAEAGVRECELRASEERLRLALGAARMIAWEYDPDADAVTTSDNLSDLYGLPPGTRLSGAEEGFRMVHPDDVAGHRAAVAAALDRGEGYVSRFRVVRPDDGRPQWMEEHGRPVRRPDGSPRLVGVVADVSDRVRAEGEVRAGEGRLRLALDAARMVVWDWDPAADRATFSPNAADVFGLPGGVTPTNSTEAYPLVHPDDLERHRATVQTAVATGQGYRTEFRMVRRDTGETIWVEERASAVTDGAGRTVRLIGIDLDVTSRRQAEERAALLTAAVESANDAVIITEALLDRPGPRIEYVNPAYTRMTGYTYAEAVGQTPRVLQGPRTSRELLDRLRQDLTERGEFTGETINYRKDGSEYTVEWRITPVRGAGGAVEKWVAVQRDVTDRRRAEERLRDQDRRKDEFLATLAHELRNPLAPLRNGLQIMRLAGGNEKSEHARRMMDRQLTQMVRLVDDLLDVSRITRGKLDLRRERVALLAVIDAAVETAGPQVEDAGHELAVRVPDVPVFVDGDPARLAQVVSNLLTNSAKYTPRGGHVRLAVERAGREVVVSVTDDGIGIPPAMLGRVFEMFTQVDRTLEKTTGGLGIGLSLVKGLVEMHGGTVTARSDGEGRGSEFVVRLPVAGAGVPAEAVRAEQPDEAVPSARRRILVVDDNRDSADSLGQLLELLGNEVRTAHDGQAGVAAATAFRPGVILMDIGMPRLNGYDAARCIREQPWGNGVVLIALTGWGQDEDRRKTADAGFDHHLVKPVNPAALTTLLAGLAVPTV